MPHDLSQSVDALLATWQAGDEESLRLVKQQPMHFENRAHFLAVCAQWMRQILLQYARRRNAAKRNPGYKLTLDDALTPARA